jgi:hypothetical protein
MKLVRIFVNKKSDEGIWSICLNGELQNEFEKFFDIMNDIEWLHDFFDKNKNDLTAAFLEKLQQAMLY